MINMLRELTFAIARQVFQLELDDLNLLLQLGDNSAHIFSVDVWRWFVCY
jgi:hypothetical protein